MKKYDYIRCDNLEKYDDWEIVQIIPSTDRNKFANMAVIMKEDKPIQDYIKLNEATNEQLIEEFMKRLEEVK